MALEVGRRVAYRPKIGRTQQAIRVQVVPTELRGGEKWGGVEGEEGEKREEREERGACM